uniref:Uncharacterized protein n=1 Tax=Arion vulgaris TaxID=1028688 RepID=A0A0B6ZWR3_9EUPU
MQEAEINNFENGNDTSVPCLSELATEKKNYVRTQQVELMEVKSSNRKLLEKVNDGEVLMNGQNEKDEMSVDRDELFTTETNNPLTLCSESGLGMVTCNNSSHADSPGAKRMTTDDDESPKPKRQTPDRSDDRLDKEEAMSNWKDEHETNLTEPDQTSKDLPNLSSDSDDDIIPTSAAQRRLLRHRHLRRRRYGRQRLSSDESDTTDDDDTNDGVKNTDDDEDKESDDDVRKAVLDILNKPVPKPNWFAVPELRKREYGYTSHQSSNTFREHVQGSLQMVTKLVLTESMKAHEGCVNALSSTE